MKCKKELMGIAAILIVIFHFWIPLTMSPVEINIYKSTYIGVDIFFFVSAYSLSKRNDIAYPKFIANRFANIYLPFVIMAVIAAVYQKWALGQALLTICGGDFFTRGGGSFLWFAVAIMLVYLIAPWMLRLKQKLGWIAFAIIIAVWLTIVCILQYAFNYTTIFILLNRMPVFIIGLYYDDLKKLISAKWLGTILIVLGLVIGGFLIYRFCGSVRLTKPIADMFYIVSVPFVLAVIALTDYICSAVKWRNVPLIFIGGFTLDIYGMQMIFGYNIESALLKTFMKTSLPKPAISLVTFIITFSILIIISWMFHTLRTSIYKIIQRKKEIKK